MFLNLRNGVGKLLNTAKQGCYYLVEQYRKDGKNLPNRITELRLIFSFVICPLLILSVGNQFLMWVVFGIFVLVILTDKLDGYLARRLNQKTKFGEGLDPTVDKVLMACVLIPSLFIFPDFQMWIGTIIFCELVVGLVSIFRRHPVNGLGKARMVIQCISVSFLLLPVEGLIFYKEIFLITALALNIISMISHIFRGFLGK